MEIWKPVVDYEGLYEVSTQGRVKSLNFGKRGIEQIMRPTPMKKGYLVVGLFKSGKQSKKLLHKLVAEAFIGPCPEGYEVNHIDGIKSNCNIGNLEYLTHQENVEHMYGVLKNHKIHPLSDDDVKKIRELKSLEFTMTELAKMFHCSRTAVFNIVNGLTYKDVT